MANQTDNEVHAVPTHEDASDAVKQGQADAVANTEAERSNSTNEGTSREEIVEDAQETARLNHKVDTEGQPDTNQDELKNDTSKKAKVDTTKSQLDPTGNDPNVSNAELTRAATDGQHVHGGTSVSNEEAARRAEEHNVPSDAPDGSGTDGEGGAPTGATEDAAGNPTLGNGETNVPADENALHPAGGKADGSAKSSSDSADKS